MYYTGSKWYHVSVRCRGRVASGRIMANNKNTKGNKGNNENVNFTFADPSRDSSLVIAELLEEQKRDERKKAAAEAKAAAESEAAADAEAEEIAEADTPDGAEVTDKETADEEDKTEKKSAGKKNTASGKAKAAETAVTKAEETSEAKAEETVSEEPEKTEEKAAAKVEKKAADNKKKKETAAKKAKKAADKEEKAEKTAAEKKKTASGKAKTAAEAQADEITEAKAEETVSEEPKKTEEKAAEKAEKKTVRKKKTASGKAKAATEAQADEITKEKVEKTVSEEPEKTEEKAAEKEEKKTADRKKAAAETSAAENAAPDTEEKRSGRVKRHLEQAEKLLKEKKESKERTVVVLAAAAVILVLFIAAVWGVYRSMYKTCYVASTSKEAILYAENEEADGELTEAGRVIRGSEIRVYRDTVETEQGVFRRAEAEQTTEKDDGADAEADDAEAAEVEAEAAEDKAEAAEDKAEDKTLYINEENIAETPDDVVRETEVYVRTPVTIYAEAEGPAIASFAPKGSCLEVRGYDSLEKDGSIHKYKIAYTDPEGEAGEGYVYGKYMTDSQESADAVYNENGIYDKAKEDVYYFNLHGGKAKNLDYYPYEKPVIEGNEFCADARTMYLNCAAVVHPKNYVKIINDTDCNAVVCDIKDGVLAYESEVAKEMSPRSYKTAYVSEEEYKAGVDALRETGAYLIGRIVVFNDPIYAKDHPENCIKEGGSTNWPSAYSRGVWEYNVRLAQEAVEKFGFNEIQFDYVRFPESSYEMSKEGGVKWRNRYDEEKGQAVQNFCFYAADQIHEAGAYFSIDVFGESAYGYMTAYGQYWPGLTNIVDAISAMPYTDHTGGEGAWEDPYGTVKRWAKRAKKMQDYVENPAAARTWITGYDTPYWAPTVDYGPKKLKQQVNALKKAGLTGGFIPWNSGSSLAKYRQYKDVWNTD